MKLRDAIALALVPLVAGFVTTASYSFANPNDVGFELLMPNASLFISHGVDTKVEASESSSVPVIKIAIPRALAKELGKMTYYAVGSTMKIRLSCEVIWEGVLHAPLLGGSFFVANPTDVEGLIVKLQKGAPKCPDR